MERVISLSLNELRDAIKSRQLKPSDVLTAFQAKVGLIGICDKGTKFRLRGLFRHFEGNWTES